MCRIIEIIRHRFFPRVRVLHAPGHEPLPSPSGRVTLYVDTERHEFDLHLPDSRSGDVYAHYRADVLVDEESVAGALARATLVAGQFGTSFRLWTHDSGAVLSVRGESSESVRVTAGRLGLGAGDYIHGSDGFVPLG